ncbi:MAG: hypothetical protein M3O01_00740, partial [Pseudomonadota bacterium]|nr:hypothetical protein [Pseudomonadota bacterium]
ASARSAHVAALVMAAPADLIVTPETALREPLARLSGDTLSSLRAFSEQTGSDLFLGVAIQTTGAGGTNSMLHLDPARRGGGFGRYDKMRLMPFGEYAPIGLAWFTDALPIPGKSLTAGANDQAPFRLVKRGRGVAIGTLICIEDMIGRDAVHWAPRVGLLLNPTDLSWFDDERAISQRLRIARLRALEVARPLLRVANTGITAQIGTRGEIVADVPTHREAVLEGMVQPVQGLTPYARWGEMPVLACCALGLGWLARSGLRRRRDSGAPRNRMGWPKRAPRR